MKTTISLVIHASSKKDAKLCFDHLLWAWDALRKSGEAPTNTFLEYGEPKGAKRDKKNK